MPGHRLRSDLLYADASVVDPGDGGTFEVNGDLTYIAIHTSGVETRTVPTPTQRGVRLLLCMETDGGDATVTVNPSASTFDGTNNTLTFDDVGDCAELISRHNGTTFYWILGANEGATASSA